MRLSPASSSFLLIRIALGVVLAAPCAVPQGQSTKGSPDLYEQVLDRVFPPAQEQSRDQMFVLTVRRKAFSKPELQFRVTQRREHPGTLEYVAAAGNIESVVSRIGLRGSAKPDEIARSIKITRHTVPVQNTTLSGWNEGFLRSIAGLNNSRTRAVEVTLDDEMIEIDYAQGLSTLSLRAPLSECGDELRAWVNDLTRKVQDIAGVSN